MSFLGGKSELKKAIERGLANERLSEELEKLDDLTLESRADGEAVCWGLTRLAGGGTTNLAQNANALAGLFQEIEDAGCDAFRTLRDRGIPELLRIFDELQEERDARDEDTLLFILKILALYSTTEGTLKIAEAVRRPLKPDSYIWSVVLGSFQAGHPGSPVLYRLLCDPLPPDFIGVALLDAANSCLIDQGEIDHPFDSREGKLRLREWLESPDESEFSYAHSATVALPFISNPERDEFLKLATNHPDGGVQLAAAWAAAVLGLEYGFQRLASYCLDVNRAQTAKRHLTDLEREDLIPASANEPGFTALSQFTEWLAHPNELGRAPDALEIIDHRTLAWPPERDVKPFWLIRYTVHDAAGLGEDDVDCGLVGSITFGLVSYKLEQRPPEDAYAVHCYWEMEQSGLITESDVTENPDQHRALLKQWRSRPLQNPIMLSVAELSPELGYPQPLVGLASARLDNDKGWVVLDGERSEWYPQSDMPAGVSESVVLMIHVGRYLLGFTKEPDRKKYLAQPASSKSDDSVIASYRRLLSDAEKQTGKARQEAFNSFGPLGTHLEEYAAALIRTREEKEIASTIRMLAPFWDHNSGYQVLGRVAFRCGEHDVAESFLVKLRENYTHSHRCEEMGLLAEIWCAHNKREDAKSLLLDCLRSLLVESKTANGSDRELFENSFQNHRTCLLRLFPQNGESILASAGILHSTRKQ